MIRPLSKRRPSGELYFRPPEIEQALSAASFLTPQGIVDRAQVADPENLHWVAEECLVYFIRQARRAGDEAFESDLLQVLLGRCADALARVVQEPRVQNAHHVRQEIISQLGELFWRDGSDETHRLDFYEIRFASALSCLRTDVLRAETRRLRKLQYVVDFPTDDAFEDLPALHGLPEQEARFHAQRLLEAIQGLSRGEKEALMLVRVLGYPIESDDPEKQTAVKKLGVSARTVRSRISRALIHLKKFEELP